MTSDFILAIHALVYMHHKKEVLSSEELATNICTNPARIRKVMTKLVQHNLVVSKRGQFGGGYSYSETLDITLDMVAKIFDQEFVEIPWRSGDKNQSCLICSGMADYTDKLYQNINDVIYKYLKTITIDEVENKLINREV